MVKNKGYTYIELLIVISIMAILAVIGRTSYLELNLRKQAEQETKKLESFISLAQEKTRAHEQACDDYAGYYSMVLSEDSENVFTARIVPQGCSPQDTYTFSNGVTFPEGTFAVQFDPLGTSATGASCVLVLSAKDKYCGKVIIESSGAVSTEMLAGDVCSCP